MRAHPLLGAVKQVTVYVDGAARGNPGPAAAGIVFQDPAGVTVKAVGKTIGVATNNVAEYFALVYALQEALMMGAQEVAVFTDSELVAKQCSGEYRVKDASLKVLWTLVDHLKRGFKKVSITHVPREENKLADKEANRALDEASLI